jgi:hypothetical protein
LVAEQKQHQSEQIAAHAQANAPILARLSVKEQTNNQEGIQYPGIEAMALIRIKASGKETTAENLVNYSSINDRASGNTADLLIQH